MHDPTTEAVHASAPAPPTVRRALRDVERATQDAGEPVPEFVDTADVLSVDYKGKLLDEVAVDAEDPVVDDDQKSKR